MHTVNQMKKRFSKVFSYEQAEVLSELINDAYTDLVKTSDFNELKEIVRDLAEAQKRTGVTVKELSEAQKRTEVTVKELSESQKEMQASIKELAEAQKRTEAKVKELSESQKEMQASIKELAKAQKQTEKELHELVIEHKETRRQLGGLSQSVGYGLEDKIIPFMPDFAKKNYGIDATFAERKNIVYPDGQFDEVNVYVEGTKEGKQVFIIGECKAQPGKKDVDKFHEMIRRVGRVLNGEILPFLVGYSFNPTVENYLRENYPGTGIFKSYEFELKYKKAG